MNSSISSPAPAPAMIDSPDLHEAILKRAEEIYLRNGSIPGHDLENWTQAEQEILREREFSAKRTAVVIDVEGVLYIGEYKAASGISYHPGEFDTGDVVSVRFEGDKMFVKRANGEELETKIVAKTG
jgi:Protein of unknown function (DUF2934)